MADKIVKGIQTIDGIAQVDYESLANLPVTDSIPTKGSENAIQSGAVYDALETKLDAKDGKAADTILFGGKAPEYYATAEKVQGLEEALGINTEGDSATSKVIEGIQDDIQGLLKNKLDATAQAVDSAKLGGQEPSYYAVKEDVMPKAGGKFTGDVTFTVEGKEVWLSFTDEDGNQTDEPWVHWYIEEE